MPHFDLLKEALEELGCKNVDILQSAEACDVTIRCYLLSEAIHQVVDEKFEDRDPITQEEG